MTGRDPGRRYLFLVGLVVGSLVTAVVAPFLADDEDPPAVVAASAGSDATTPLPTTGVVDAGVTTTIAPLDATGAARRATGGRAGATATQSGAAETGAQQASDPTGLGPTDHGVLADRIRLGVLIHDTDAIKATGICSRCPTVEETKQSWQVFVDDLNARGGVLGRKIEAFYHPFNNLNNDDMRAACLSLTQDSKVFAVFDQGSYLQPLCVTQENKRPFINNFMGGMWLDAYEKSGGLQFTLSPQGSRTLSALARELHRSGALKGKTIGVVTGDLVDPNGRTVQRGFIDTIGSLGYKVAHFTRLSGDPSTAASQIPVEITQMRQKGVDFVMFGENAIFWATWTQAADAQKWDPTYALSDYAVMGTDVSVENTPQSADGTMLLAFTKAGGVRAGEAETPLETTCRELWEKSKNQKLPPDGTLYGGILGMCGIFRVFEAAAVKAGPNLTIAGFANAMQQLGEIDLPNAMPGSFGPGKFGAADHHRWLRISTACKCLVVAGEWRRADP